MTDFSVAIPMRNSELGLLKRNLQSWCALKPSEILLGLEKPALQQCVNAATDIASRYNVDLRIIEIERNPEYKMHQAWARRKCFREAKHDIILTGDMDLYVYPACLKAIDLVGKDNVGLVSLSKMRNRRNISGIIRNFILNRIQESKRKGGLPKEKQAYFTGLYCIYRPYWLDSEDEDSIKNMPHPYDAPLLMDSWGGYRGEDTFLRDKMIKKHLCIYLPDIGAQDLRPGLEERKQIQAKIGMKLAYEGVGPIHVLIHTVVNLRFHVFRSYVKQLGEIRGSGVTFEIARILVAYGTFTVLYFLLKRFLSFQSYLGRKRRKWPEKRMPNVRRIGGKYVERLLLKTLLATYRHEFLVSLALKKIRGDLFVDVGANKGYYSLLLRNNFKRIVSFEPAASYYDLLNNIKLLSAESRIHVEKVAVSNNESEGLLYLAKSLEYNRILAEEQLVAGPGIANYGREVLLQQEKVAKVSLATYFREEKSIDLIKVDVGGSEWEVLDGAVPIIDRIKTWLVELYDPSRNNEMQEWFIQYGYNVKLLSYSSRCHILAWR